MQGNSVSTARSCLPGSAYRKRVSRVGCAACTNRCAMCLNDPLHNGAFRHVLCVATERQKRMERHVRIISRFIFFFRRTKSPECTAEPAFAFGCVIRFSNSTGTPTRAFSILVSVHSTRCSAGNKSILPELHVITEGLWKGFVIIIPRWSGFREQEYLRAFCTRLHPFCTQMHPL